MTCLEGMASGCPVVATTAGAWPEIVTPGEDGWIARANDRADLARALENALATDAETMAAMGRRACAKVTRDFAIEREAAGLLTVYQALFDSAEAKTKPSDPAE